MLMLVERHTHTAALFDNKTDRDKQTNKTHPMKLKIAKNK